jgi:hypothetical protein
MAARENLGRQWHGSLEVKNNGTSSGGDKYNRPADRLAAKPKTAAALKPDPFNKK